jgi:ADP-heptose:LPS heptosyltransferase
MQRFDDQPLRERPHLAVLFQDKLGGFVVTTPLLRGLKEKYPDSVVDYFGGERTAELEGACRYVNSRYSLYGRPNALRELPSFVAQRETVAGPYDLAINLDFNPVNAVATTMLAPTYVVGRCFQPDGRRELPFGSNALDQLQLPSTFWAGEDFLAQHAGVLESNFIGEIFCRLARVETDFHRTEVPTAPPPIDVPDVLVATGGTRLAKLWSTEAWIQLVRDLCQNSLSVGLLGAAPAVQRSAYGSSDTEDAILAATELIDLRGRLTLPEVAGALQRARGCVVIDNGIMHLAAAVGTPTVALFGASPAELWVPQLPWLYVAQSPVACSLCRENHFLNDGCLRDQHVCMNGIAPASVAILLRSKLRPRS